VAGATAGGAGGASGASGTPANTGGANATAGVGGGVAPAVTECNGVQLPPRALAKVGPFQIGPKNGGLPEYWPTAGWKTETPDKLGFDPQKLEQALAFETEQSNTQAIFVVRHGYVAAEKYFGSFTASSRHDSFSMAKSFTSGLIGIAIAEGKIASTDAKLCEYYPMQWDCSDTDDQRSRITIDHAMNLTTGLRWQEDWRAGASGTNDAASASFAGMVDTALARECVAEPGSMKRYSTGDPALLVGPIEQSTGMTAYQYAKQKLFDVIGIPDVRWGMDSRGRTTVYAGLQATAAEFAKYGYLLLNGGHWDGKQVIPADWIARTTRAQKPCEDWNQWLWHVNLPLRLGKQPADCVDSGMAFCTPTDIANVPFDGFTAKGINGQYIMIMPSADLVVVRLASDAAGSQYWDVYARGLLEGILDAMK
jgi:CubicO group peptidase (beta-lactamase class C family)